MFNSMTMFQFISFFALATVFGFQASTSTAFTSVSLCQKPCANALIGSQRNSKNFQEYDGLKFGSLNVLSSSPGSGMSDDELEANDDSGAGPSMSMPTSSAPQQQQQAETPAAYVPPPPTPTRNSPPVVRQQRMDPLMASLTRDSSNASPDQPTQNIPIFGEIPADGTLLLLAPAAVFAILGFIYSIVIAFNASDQIVNSMLQAGGSVEQSAKNRNNRVYDKNVCRGLCSSQQEDIDGMKNFMEAITRNAREGK